MDENILRLLELCRAGRAPAEMVREIRAKPEFSAMTDLPDRIRNLVMELVSHGMLVPAGTVRD